VPQAMGLRGTTIGLVPAEDLLYGSDHYERFWAACQDLAMSVNLPLNSGPGRMKFSPQQRSGSCRMERAGHKWGLHERRWANNRSLRGVFERYPR